MFPSWVLYALLASTTLILLLKFVKTEYFLYKLTLIYKTPTSSTFTIKEASFLDWGSITFLINYIITTSLAVFMMGKYWGNDLGLVILAPTIFYFFQRLALLLAGFLSGERQKLKANKSFLNIINYYIGLMLLPTLLVWLLNPGLSTIMINSIFTIFILLHFYKIIKGILIAFQNKITWYYIILYLCNLEILPVAILYFSIRYNFQIIS